MARPDDRDLDDEIRGHLALEAKERVDRGTDPGAARREAAREFGYIPAVRESMRRVWYSRWWDAAAALAREVRLGLRSLMRSKGLVATVVITLALGIGANAAIFSLLSGVLLRPLVNRDEARLIYIEQTAPGIGVADYTFSVPEIADLERSATTIEAFGDFSTVDLALSTPGSEPRMVKAGVVNGAYFDVMGLRPALGRLLTPHDDGPAAAGAAVLTYRFWTTAFNSDPAVVGRQIRLGVGPATIVGVLEPSVPYPTETEIIANIVTSPHHLGATMNTRRTHRMTDLFGRLKPGVSLETARAELTSLHEALVRAHPEAYPSRANVQLRVSRLRDQIAAPARTILFVLLAAAAIVFVIACSNVANLILARSLRREGELALRAALGAGRAALRRTLLGESLVLCTGGAVAGLLLARPLVALMARYASRFSIRALEATVDSDVVWVGAGLAMVAAVVLAFVPRLPTSLDPAGLGGSSGLRITPSTNRRLRLFATMQIACSFLLLAGAAMLVGALVALQSGRTGLDVRHVLAFDIPQGAPGTGKDGKALRAFYDETARRVSQIPGVDAVAVGSFVPWRDAGDMSSMFNEAFTAEGYALAQAEEAPRAHMRFISSGLLSVMGVPLIAGREFTDQEVRDEAPVVIVSQSIAQRYFSSALAVDRHLSSIDLMSGDQTHVQRRIVGVVADVDDEHLAGQPALTIYHPFSIQLGLGMGSRFFVRAARDPHALVAAVTRTIHEISPSQPVERAATLEEVRDELLTPTRTNALVFSGFAAIALLIASVGVAGVLAFSVSARTREFSIRLALGCTPRSLLAHVLSSGAVIAAVGICIGGAAGLVLVRLATSLFSSVEIPGAPAVMTAIFVLLGAALAASWLPAARASRIDVLEGLRAE
jgi:predicted permease